MPFIPHTQNDEQEMLSTIGVSSVDQLFDEIPPELKFHGFQTIPDPLNEMDMLKLAEKLAARNTNGLCFIGAGSYDHHIPAAVWSIATRGEFLTAYTPYQAEASQGTLQLLYEFQTLIAELTGMDVANASLYDGASSLAEAVLMAVRLNRHTQNHRILVPDSLHPHYQATLKTIVCNQNIELISLPFDPQKGITDPNTLSAYAHGEITALIIPQPNFFGCLEPVDMLSDIAYEKGMTRIACVNPISLGLLKPPNQWGQHGVDIVCGEGQPLGVPMASGGPYFGFLSTKMEHVRQIPGRLVGCTVDKEGKQGFTLTLQAREQHIRRAKATSNICTNQGLLVTGATIHMCLLGPQGLKNVATTCHLHTKALLQALTSIPGVTRFFKDTPYFHEVVIQLPCAASEVVNALKEQAILAGLDLCIYHPNLPRTLLICATEKYGYEEIEIYRNALSHFLSGASSC
jgi:glycine dehydrogenase subunit 1